MSDDWFVLRLSKARANYVRLGFNGRRYRWKGKRKWRLFYTDTRGNFKAEWISGFQAWQFRFKAWRIRFMKWFGMSGTTHSQIETASAEVGTGLLGWIRFRRRTVKVECPDCFRDFRVWKDAFDEWGKAIVDCLLCNERVRVSRY